MSDSVESDDLEVLLVKDGEPEVEQVVEEPPKPEGKVLSEEEYQRLVQSGDAARTLAEPLSQLAGRMQQSQPVVQRPEETDEEFYARIEQTAFQPGQFGKAIQEASRRNLSPVLREMATTILNQEKALLKVDPEKGETFRRYEKEIVETARGLPQGPGVYEQAYQQVMLRHQGDIINERIDSAMNAKREEIRKELLAEYGIDPDAEPVRKAPAVGSLGGRVGAGNAAATKPSPLRLYESERDRMVQMGLDPKNADAVRNFLKNHPRRR